MSVQRYTLATGEVRYRARVKSHGREVATRVFERKKDAEAWEEEQKRRLRHGEWFDPRRGRVPLKVVAEEWLASRRTVKRRTAETDEASWRLHVGPRFGNRPVVSITTAEIEQWMGVLIADGASPRARSATSPPSEPCSTTHSATTGSPTTPPHSSVHRRAGTCDGRRGS